MVNRVLINASVLGRMETGVETSLMNLLGALNNGASEQIEFEVLCNQKAFPRIVSNLNLTVRPLAPSARLRRVIWEHFRMSSLTSEGPSTLLHSPTYLLPFQAGKGSVVTCHDLIALHSPRLCHPRTRNYYRLALPWTLKRAAHIICVSETVQQQIHRRFPACVGKTTVIPNVIHASFSDSLDEDSSRPVPDFTRQGRPYVLFVGKMEAKKNLPRLIQAFHLARQEGNIPHDLVIAGTPGWGFGKVKKTLAELGNPAWCRLLGYVSEDELPHLYRGADLFVFPSLYEGFGMPPLEALASGIPVLASNRGSLPEVLGKHACFADPLSVEDLAAQLIALLENETKRNQMLEGREEWLGQYRADQVRAQYLAFYRQIFNQLSPSTSP